VSGPENWRLGNTKTEHSSALLLISLLSCDTLCAEKGLDPFDILPEGWLIVTHMSGMPVYLHKQLRVCTLSRPYFLGPGSARVCVILWNISLRLQLACRCFVCALQSLITHNVIAWKGIWYYSYLFIFSSAVTTSSVVVRHLLLKLFLLFLVNSCFRETWY